MQKLYSVLIHGQRKQFAQHIQNLEDVEDKTHDLFLILVHDIRRGALREPRRLMGYARSIAGRQICDYIRRAVWSRGHALELKPNLPDRSVSPELLAMRSETARSITRILGMLNPKYREILTRFYLDEQTRDELCLELHLTVRQFDQRKHRATVAFGIAGARGPVKTLIH